MSRRGWFAFWVVLAVAGVYALACNACRVGWAVHDRDLLAFFVHWGLLGLGVHYTRLALVYARADSSDRRTT